MTSRSASQRLLLPILLVAGAIVVLLAACGQTSGGPGQQQNTPMPKGTLAGDVVAGPTCPVERAKSPCPPRPIADRQVTITTPGGAVATTTTTDANGRFSVMLVPGIYVVQVAIVPGQVGLRQETDGRVTVVAGQITSITLMLDTGIR